MPLPQHRRAKKDCEDSGQEEKPLPGLLDTALEAAQYRALMMLVLVTSTSCRRASRWRLSLARSGPGRRQGYRHGRKRKRQQSGRQRTRSGRIGGCRAGCGVAARTGYNNLRRVNICSKCAARTHVTAHGPARGSGQRARTDVSV
eukprot:7381002-Prymnesium_polylepis.1